MAFANRVKKEERSAYEKDTHSRFTSNGAYLDETR